MVAIMAAPYAGVGRIRFLGSSSLVSNFELSAIGLPCVIDNYQAKPAERQVMPHLPPKRRFRISSSLDGGPSRT